jgi:DNA polymerase-1
MKIKRLVLLDAHAIIHRAYHALPDYFSSKGEPTGALYGLSSMLMKIIADLKPDYVVACYDLPQKTFRHEAYENYKAGRAKADEALVEQLKTSRGIFESFNIPIYDAPGFEADDILGTIVEKFKNDKSVHIVIASGDMDTLQLVNDKKVQVYTLKKGIQDTIIYDEEAVLARFGFRPKLLQDYKGLRGDPSDNIIGIKGIGEKIATDLIVNFGSIEEIYKKIKKDPESFIKAGIKPRIVELLKNNEEEAEFSKTLATIRLDAPIDFALPAKTFWESIDLEKIKNIFLHYDFRSLTNRLENLLKNSSPKDIGSETSYIQKTALLDVLSPTSHSASSALLQETAIALWLINSDLTNPSMEDILNFAQVAAKGTVQELPLEAFELAREYIFKELKEKGLEKVYEEVEKPIIPIVQEMEKYGILVDQKYFENLSQEYGKNLEKITEKIYEIAGTEFNINSPKQLGEVLFEKMGLKSRKRKTAGGALSTKLSVLEEIEHPIIEEIIAYRELQKLLSTYINVIPKLAGEDGRLHANFLQNGTTTGRFSSQDPNLQNLPIKTELGARIRNGFITPKGYKLVTFDYSQIELRVAALLSGDKKMLEIFKNKKDIHSGVAAFVFGVPLEKVDKEMRRQAKVINFGIIYGMGIVSLRKSLGGTREEAQDFYNNYFNQFSGVQDYLESVKEFARKNLYTQTLFGRRRNFPNINSKVPFLKSLAERMAINAPIQGTSADLIKLAIRYVQEDLEKASLLNKVHLVLQIHDELVYEIAEDVLPQAQIIIKEAMENVLTRSMSRFDLDISGSVPLEVKSGVGNNLGEAK